MIPLRVTLQSVVILVMLLWPLDSSITIVMMFVVRATATMAINYDSNKFIVQANGHR